MLRLPAFKYVAPTSVSGVVAVLAQHGAAARLLAGGTDLLPNMKRRQLQPTVLVGLRGIRELRDIRPTPAGGLVIGALVTLSEVAAHPVVRQNYRALAQAASLVATPQIRDCGTLGGNLCLDTRCFYYDQTEEWREALGYCMKSQGDICQVATSSPKCLAINSSDTAVTLLALGGVVRLAGPQGVREVSASSLYRDDGIDYMAKEPTEILTEVELPPATGLRSGYLKLRQRGSFDFPIMSVAAAAQLEGGVIRKLRVVLGAMGPCPVEVPETSELVGRGSLEEAIGNIDRAAYQRAKPLDNGELTASYRKRMAQVYTNRLLRELLLGNLDAQ